MLKTQAIGNLGRDPERKGEGTATRATFSIGCNKKVKGENQTTWVNVTVFGEKRVDFVMGYIKKGSKVFIEGDTAARAYTSKSGEPAASLDVTVGSFDGKLELLSSDRNAASTQDNGSNAASTQGGGASSGWSDDLDDDLPGWN